jgi:signal transduction histidine kinase/CheY-like chemotaxis protein
VLAFWSVFGLLFNYSFFIQIVCLSGLIFYGSIYLLQKKGLAFRLLTLGYYYSALVLLAITWLPAGGMLGTASTFLFLLFFFGLMVLPLRDYFIFILFSISVVCIYAYLEIEHVDLAAKYESDIYLIRDLSITNIIVFLIAGIALFMFKRSYLKERFKLKKREEELSGAIEKAKSADQAKTDFLTTVSYEMMTPLNGIMRMTDLLSGSPLDAEQKSLLHHLRLDTKRLHGLIIDVLDMATIDTAKAQLNMSVIDFWSEMDALGRIFKNRVRSEQKDIELIFDLKEDIPEYLHVEINRLRQVLINLVNNAIKFTKRGVVRLEITPLSITSQIVTLQFNVSDTGEGIKGDSKEEIFNRIFKGSENATIEDTGLGLSTVKKLVELMGGTIDFKTVYGSGSHFFFELEFDICEKPITIDTSDDELVFDLSFLSILIVEDVKINQLVVSKILRGLGANKITVANNGEESLSIFRESFYDLIFMDLQMPGITGIEAARKIVALTANATQQDYEDCLAAGMSDFITKPFKVDDLSRVIPKLFDATSLMVTKQKTP